MQQNIFGVVISSQLRFLQVLASNKSSLGVYKLESASTTMLVITKTLINVKLFSIKNASRSGLHCKRALKPAARALQTRSLSCARASRSSSHDRHCRADYRRTGRRSRSTCGVCVFPLAPRCSRKDRPTTASCPIRHRSNRALSRQKGARLQAADLRANAAAIDTNLLATRKRESNR